MLQGSVTHACTRVRMLDPGFEEGNLHFVNNRRKSAEISKSNTLENLKKELGQHEIVRWDLNFKKAIGFNKIGVMRAERRRLWSNWYIVAPPKKLTTVSIFQIFIVSCQA